jgi:hypothetical protein
MLGVKEQPLPDGDLLVVVNGHVSEEAAHRIREHIATTIGRRALVVGKGITVHPLVTADRLLAIERKLDILIAALAEDGEESPTTSLDDGRTFAARDASRGLG